jgi:hypothetical protein
MEAVNICKFLARICVLTAQKLAFLFWWLIDLASLESYFDPGNFELPYAKEVFLHPG